MEHLKVRVPTAEDSAREAPAGPEVRSTDSLTESYAQASAELGFAVSELREARDLLRVASRGGAAGPRAGDRGPGEDRRRGAPPGDPEGAREGGRGLGGHAAALHRRIDAGAGPAPAPGRSPFPHHLGRGARRGGEGLAEPQLEEASSSPQLAQALCAGEPSFEAVALVPLRSAERLLGLALLYFGPYAALPPADAVVHLGFLARVLAGPLEAAAAREAASAGDRLKVLSRASSAAVASLLTRLPWELARRRPLRLVDVLGPLGGSGVSIEASSPATSVLGDAPLLRFAFASLVRQCEADALERGQIPEVSVRVEEDGDAVRVRVTGGGAPR